MSLRDSIANAAMAEADRKRRIEADARALADKALQKKVWHAFNAVCEFVPRGPADAAAWKWAGLIVAACDQLKAAGEIRRLEAMRYTGPDPVRKAGMEAAFQVCRFACTGKTYEVTAAMKTLIESAAEIDSPFRLYLESVRDNRQVWPATVASGCRPTCETTA